MTGIQFVPQTGTKKDDRDTRRSIRRHVMLGKNQGRTRDPKQPALSGCTVFRLDDSEHVVRDQPIQSVVPRRVGSDLSFLEFADAVELPLMNDAFRLCSASDEEMFALEPCIAFNSTDIIATCLQSLAYDALHLNVMVFGTQAYMDLIYCQTTSGLQRSSCKTVLRHYGQALCLLRQRLADVERRNCEISDITIMSVTTLAMLALINGDAQIARNHAAGLSRLVAMKEHGVYSFKRKTKQLIEILRCDISISLATGQAPLFFADPSRESILKLPELAALDYSKTTERCPAITNSELARLWDVLGRFCAMINKAATNRTKLSDQVLLETMASVMYRLLNMSAIRGSTDGIVRLAMLSFCASALLPLRQLRLPFGWLDREYRRSISDLMQAGLDHLNPEAALWCLTVYGIAFSLHPVKDGAEIQSWLMEVTNLCGLESWNDVKGVLDGFLWIVIVCDKTAQKLFEKTLAQRVL